MRPPRVDRFDGLDTVDAELRATHERLGDWAQWLRWRAPSPKTSPGFALYRSSDARSPDPIPHRAPVDVKAAIIIEHIVADLGVLHRDLLRLHYVRNRHPMEICRRLDLHPSLLKPKLHEAREQVRDSLARTETRRYSSAFDGA